MANKAHLNFYKPDEVSPPGETLVELLESVGMSQAELAERAGRPKKTISEIATGASAITPDTALQFERVLGVPASFWNNREQNYQEYLARKKESERLEPRADWIQRFPLREMIERGWIRKSEQRVDQIREVLNYFGIATPDQWATVWLRPSAAFRKSNAFEADPYAVSAWLRKGEQDASGIYTKPYDENNFLDALQQIRRLTTHLPEEFIPKMTELCAGSGVAIVFVPELPKTRVSGATRWIHAKNTTPKALIQMSLRYKTNDHFWFTFFHEAGHILLHGRRDFFIENGGIDNETYRDKEAEADSFARDFLIPADAYREFRPSATYFSKKDIVAFAERISIAPGIVVGRLQHDGRLEMKNCNDLKVSYAWA